MDVENKELMIDSAKLPDVVVAGDIDLSNAGRLASALESIIGRGIAEISLDLCGAGFLDSCGIRVLLQCREQAMAAGCRFNITAASPLIIKALHLSGFAPLFGLPQLKLETTPPPAALVPAQGWEWNTYESVALSEPELLKPMRDVAVGAAIEAGLDAELEADVELAVGEALANAVRHGSPNGSKSRMRLKCLSCSSALVIEVTDDGEEFDFEHILASELTEQAGPGETPIGLRLMTRAMDEVEYQHTGSGNRIRMVKWLSTTP